MKPIALLPLAVFLLVSQVALSRADCSAPQHSNSGEAKCRKDTCTDVVKRRGSHESSEESAASPASPASSASPASPAGPSSSVSPATKSASSEEFDCILIEVLRNISVTLTIELQYELEILIESLQVDILLDVTLTDIEKVIKCAYKIKHFMEKHLEIKKVMQFAKIGDWEGTFFDFTYVAIDLSADVIESVVTLDANDDCALFEALLNATRNDSAKYSLTLDLVMELRFVLLDVSFTFGQKMAKFHKIIKKFFDKNPSLKSFFLEIEIEGFGSFEAIEDVCHGYHRALTFSTVMVGSGDSDCPLLAALADAYANTSFTITVRSQLKNYHDKLLAKFVSMTDLELRIVYMSQQYWQMIIMEPWIVQYLSLVTIDDVTGEEWGCFYDLTWVSQFCNNTDSCGCMSCGLGDADCASRVSLISITAQNTTFLTDSLQVTYNSWNTSTRLGFNSCFNWIKKAIWDFGTYPTVKSKINAIRFNFTQYNANNAVKQQVLYNSTISIWEGLVSDYVSCGNL